MRLPTFAEPKTLQEEGEADAKEVLESKVGEGQVVVEETHLIFRFRGLRVQAARHLVGSMELDGEEKL